MNKKHRKLLCYGPYCYPKRIKHNRNELITCHHKHYCQKCFRYLKQLHFYRHQLYKYIEQEAHISYPTGIMLRDLKHLHKKYKYNYRGITNALQYAYKYSMKFNFDGQFFLRYVPFVYDKAQKWKYNRDKHDNLNLNVTHINNEVKYASVDSKVFKPKKKKHYFNMDKF